MNYILDSFLVGFINGLTATLWGIIAVILFLIIINILSNNNDDDDDDGTLQPVYQGANK